jgi:hypothetical protein
VTAEAWNSRNFLRAEFQRPTIIGQPDPLSEYEVPKGIPCLPCFRGDSPRKTSLPKTHPIISQADAALRVRLSRQTPTVRTSFIRHQQLQVEIVDKQLKSMMRELGDAINSSLSDSEQIAEVISRIKAGGYDVFVVLEATIGFNQQEQEESETQQLTPADFEMTPQDLRFLKSLRIRIDQD